MAKSGKRERRNHLVERAVRAALDRIDQLMNGGTIEMPRPEHRRQVDRLIAKRSNSVRLATLYLLFYWLEDPAWNRRDVPVGTRGKYGDKLFAEELNKRGITLHGNITAYGENLGWKGNVRQFDLATDERFDIFSKLGALCPDEVRKVSDYLASLFAQSRVVIAPLPGVGRDVLTFARAKLLLHKLIGTPSEGHIQQFLVAALLYVHRERHGYDVKTHHPHASDKFDQSAGDIEEFFEGRLVRAYEVTVRDDWQNRISNFKDKMDEFGLGKYIIIAPNVLKSREWSEPANVLTKLEPYGRDIAVIDILEFANVFAAELNARELRAAVNKAYDFLLNNKLCGRPEIIQRYRDVVDEWLDLTT